MYIKRLLCPIALSECSRAVLYHAAAIADWYGAELHALHVLARTAVSSTTERALKELAAASTLSEAIAKASIAIGDPATRIIEYIHAMRIDLVVLGMRAADDAAESVGAEVRVHDATTDRLCDAAPCPIIVVPASVRAAGAGAGAAVATGATSRTGAIAEPARLTRLLSAFDLSPSIARCRTLAHGLG